MIELHAFGESCELAKRLEAALPGEASLRTVDVHRFPDRESRVRVASDGAARAVVLRSLDDPNPKLFELLLAADALRRRGVREVGLVAPYLAYMRQDRVFHEGEALSQQVIGRLLSAAFDQVLTVEAHLHRIQRLEEAFTCPARSLSAAPLVAERYRGAPEPWRVIGPDEESEPWVRGVAEAAGLPYTIAHKRRSGDRRVEVELPPMPETTHAVLVDDIASSGVTLAALAGMLRERGVQRCEAVVVHALLSPEAEARLAAAGIDALVSTDTIPHASNALSVAPLLARALAPDTEGAD